MITVTALMLSGLASAQTYEFNTCGASGRFGPSQSQCDSAYSGTNLEAEVNVVGEGIQEWTVPEDGEYRITAAGAQGGDKPDYQNNGGRGVVLTANVSLQKDKTLSVVVGQEGGQSQSSDSSGGGGGGGGSFVYAGENKLYIASGGGGGIGAGNAKRNPGRDASIERSPGIAQQDYNSGQTTYTSYVQAGEGGDSYGNCCESAGDYDSGGGAGWNSDGRDGTHWPDTEGGYTRTNGWLGGDYDIDRSPYIARGGFGGGGAASDGGGGGGGYTGGNGGRWARVASGGGGGTSYVIGNRDPQLKDYNTGQGYVRIEYLAKEEINFCDFRGPFNECIMNQTNSLSPRQFNVSRPLLVRPDAVFTAFSGRSILNVTNSTSLSGSWRGEFTVKTESPEIGAGTRLEPRNGDIVIGG